MMALTDLTTALMATLAWVMQAGQRRDSGRERACPAADLENPAYQLHLFPAQV
jgi:hypothetical protein